jgi:hypothetical protein
MVIFGYQDAWLRPGCSHTFAMFAKVDMSEGQMVVHESVDISWLPKRLRPSQQIWDWVVPVTGNNFTLHESFAFATAPGLSLKTFGPVEVSHELYDAARRKADWLESGQVKYVILDNLHRERAASFVPGGATNCIHAVCDLAITKPLNTHVTYGHKASELVFNHFDPFIAKGPGSLATDHLHHVVPRVLDASGREIRVA